jgi:hypothetical protein
MILSDLGVHREQAGGTASYFGTDDPATLADHIVRVAQESAVPLVRSLVPNHDDRVAAFATDFANTVRHAIRVSPR